MGSKNVKKLIQLYLLCFNHLIILPADLKEKFSHLRQIDFPTWMVQLMLADLSDVTNMQCREEMAELQNDESVKTEVELPKFNQTCQKNYCYRYHLHS